LTKERSEFVPMCDTQQGQRIALWWNLSA
jgi:hypothetical protein